MVEYLKNYATVRKAEIENEEKENNGNDDGESRKVADSAVQTPLP